MVNTPCRLVGYLRVSTQSQGASGLGLEGQEAAVAAHVASSGCELIATYTEVESGKKSNRSELLRAMAHAKRAKATLVIAKLDRLSRNVHFISGLMESGVEFVACDNPVANRFTVHILAACAEQEARAISERTKAALAAYKARGGLLGSQRRGHPKLTPEAIEKGVRQSLKVRSAKRREAMADLVPTLCSMRANGMSLRAIARELNELGQTTSRGKGWDATAVLRVLALG
jgi:DNA invertase Pin-like site-specific DNA recombinase